MEGGGGDAERNADTKTHSDGTCGETRTRRSTVIGVRGQEGSGGRVWRGGMCGRKSNENENPEVESDSAEMRARPSVHARKCT